MRQLQRHGSRYPTESAGADIEAAINKLRAAKHYKDHRLAFLKDFKYDLGTSDLIPFGAAQYVYQLDTLLPILRLRRRSYNAGQVSYRRYAYLVGEDEVPFVRAASSERVVDSAMNWTAG